MAEWKKHSHKRRIDWTVDGLMPDIDYHTKTKHLLLESYLQDWGRNPNRKLQNWDGSSNSN
jgi:hypothetical protein